MKFRSLTLAFVRAQDTARRFPATVAFAVAFAVVTMVRIHMDWPAQQTYNFLFNCLHLSFAAGALFSLAAVTAAQTRLGDKRSFWLANAGGAVLTGLVFVLLYWFGAAPPDPGRIADLRLSDLAAARVSVLMLISVLVFILFAGQPEDRSDFARALFMTHKAFFIALIYGVVIMLGTSGVAGAVQALLYRDMSSKVYQYLSTISLLLAFLIFVGYFPEFKKGKEDAHREIAQQHPRFIEVLLQYILVPIALVLTGVLLLWTLRTLVSGDWPTFERLSGIATSYALIGIWLHILLSRYDAQPAVFYRRVYPVCALFILAFEAWALIVQIRSFGITESEYFFGLIWVFAVIASVLLILRRQRAHVPIALLICGLAVAAVLPGTGYHSLPVRMQVSRLESTLTELGMLSDGELRPAEESPAREVRVYITRAVEYLGRQETDKLPAWFDEELGKGANFQERFGFERTWPQTENGLEPRPAQNINIRLDNQAIEIDDWRWVVFLSEFGTGRFDSATAEVEGERGRYELVWSQEEPDRVPTFTLLLDGRVLIERNLKTFLDDLGRRYPPQSEPYLLQDAEALSLTLSSEEADVLLVFRSADLWLDVERDEFDYWLDLRLVCLRENE